MACTRQGLLACRLGAGLLRHHQLGDRERERGRQRRHARPLCDGPERRDARRTRAHAPGAQDPARRDHLQRRRRRRHCASARLEVGPAPRLRDDRDGDHGRRDPHLHRGLPRLDPLLLPRAAERVQPAPAPGLPAPRRDRVCLSALLPVQGLAGQSTRLRELDRDRVDGARSDRSVRALGDATAGARERRPDLRRRRSAGGDDAAPAPAGK